MLDNLKKYKIILGSNSPRRRELLTGLDIDFQIITNDIEESYKQAIKDYIEKINSDKDYFNLTGGSDKEFIKLK